MILSKLHTPEGVKDYLPIECKRKREIENNIINVFERFSYSQIKTPTFEFNEVFECTGSVKNKRELNFLDRDGSLLALRADMTPVIARIAATVYQKQDLPLKFYYVENMFRTNVNYQGKLREFTQAGVELMGVNSIDADIEIIILAISSLLASGVKEFKINISHSNFLKSILNEALLEEEKKIEILESISNKNFVEVSRLAKDIENKDIKFILEELPFLVGKIDVIDKVSDKVKDKSSLDYLKNIYEILKSLGYEKYILFDLGVIGSMNYYTGIVFRGYVKGTGESILDGGRYDKMVEKFGFEMAAVGFAIKINEVLKVVKQKVEKEESYVGFYSEENRIFAFREINKMRNMGYKIENNFLCSSFESTIKYAKEKNIDFVINFDDLKMYDVKNENMAYFKL